MAKRSTGLTTNRKKPSSHKTVKRLEAKKIMLKSGGRKKYQR